MTSNEHSLRPLFAPTSIAVVGASLDPTKLGSVLVRSLTGFPGSVYGINPRTPDAAKNLYASIHNVPEEVDLAMLCVPAQHSANALKDAAQAGVKAAIICAGGFAEAGVEGVEYEQAIREVLEMFPLRLLGPNTSGFFVPAAPTLASFVPGVDQVLPGTIAVVASSGGMNHALAFLLSEAGYGVSVGVGLGNAVDVSTVDVLEYLLTDEQTKAIALHIESIGDARRLLGVLGEVTRSRPVVALVVGQTDVGAFAESHTGALASSWRTIRSALRQRGVVVVDNERELVDAVGALSCGRLRARPEADRQPGVGIVTGQAGPGLLVLDGLQGKSVSVPPLKASTKLKLDALLPPLTFQGNPVDTGRPGPTFSDVLRAVAADPAIDAIGIYALNEPDALDIREVLTTATRDSDLPVVAGVGGSGDQVRDVRRRLIQGGIAATSDPSGLVTALWALVEDRTLATLQANSLAATTDSFADVVLGSGPFDEDQAKHILNQLGLSTPLRKRCASLEQALEAQADLGPRTALKILNSDVLHKTEVGGLRLGISSREQLSEAWLDLEGIEGPSERLIEAMADDGIDLVASAFRDPLFGPMVLFGFGGTDAEVRPDVTVRLAPLDPATAADMVSDLSGKALLDGWRGGPSLDTAALGDLLVALGGAISSSPHVDLIEINPLRLVGSSDAGVAGSQLVALDAVVTVSSDPQLAGSVSP